ncbi:adenylate kinase family protein [Candidatus Woesearchaeota archaeon]|nr:adenylate kinase family protein [Candidatus Woesearchaeota archaeon]
MAKAILVTGSVGSGKTTVSKLLAKKLRWTYIDVNLIIKKNPFVVTGFDTKRDSKIIDTIKLSKVLASLILKSSKNLIIDSHLSHYVPAQYANLCIVTKCSLKTLRKRLKKRKYTTAKIQENVEAEIFDVCLIEALESGHHVHVLKTDKPIQRQLKNIFH